MFSRALPCFELRPTTPQDYPEWSGFGRRREREWVTGGNGPRHKSGEPSRCASTSLANDGIMSREPLPRVTEGEIAVTSKAELQAAPLSGKRLLALWNALPSVEKRKVMLQNRTYLGEIVYRSGNPIPANTCRSSIAMGCRSLSTRRQYCRAQLRHTNSSAEPARRPIVPSRRQLDDADPGRQEMCPPDRESPSLPFRNVTAVGVGRRRARSPSVAQRPTGARLSGARNRTTCLPSERQLVERLSQPLNRRASR